MSTTNRVQEMEQALNRASLELFEARAAIHDLTQEIEALKASPTWKIGRLALRALHVLTFNALKGGGPRVLRRLRTRTVGGANDVASSVDENRLVRALFGDEVGLMIDVGAHHGGAFDAFARSGWTVHAFEPNPLNARRLEEAIRTLHNVVLDVRAVSDRDGDRVTLYASEVSSGISGLLRFHESHRPIGHVETVSLRTYLQERSIESVDYLKIDTEGHDYSVLVGFPFERLQPRVVTCEFEDRKVGAAGPSYHDLAERLRDCGYQILVSEWYPIVEYGGPHRWRCFGAYPHELSHPDAWGNLIACHRSEDFDALMRLPEVVRGVR